MDKNQKVSARSAVKRGRSFLKGPRVDFSYENHGDFEMCKMCKGGVSNELNYAYCVYIHVYICIYMCDMIFWVSSYL